MDMDEATIADKLKQNLPKPYETDIAPVETPESGAETVAPTGLDELTQYKLHNYFGEQYKQTDEVKRQQLHYIYEKVTEMVHAPDYGFVVAKIRDLEQILGTFNSEDRLYKLYQWLKLENVRKGVEAEQGALSG